MLDVQFKEDDDKKSERKSARSFALIRRVALNMIRAKKDKLPPKIGINSFMKQASWDDSFLLHLLS